MDFTEHYIGMVGELTLKGANVKQFEKQLILNVKAAVGSANIQIRTQTGRLYVSCKKEISEKLEYALDHLIGITAWAKVNVIQKDIDSIRKAIFDLCTVEKEKGATSFKIEARREDKSFPLNSFEICRDGAGLVFDSGLLRVDVHNPDVTVVVEVRNECFVYCTQKKTCRGLPVGVSGRGLLLLSGGLDSPVAGYRILRRGMKIDCAYFHSYPYTSEEAQKKVEDLARVLGDFGVETHLNVIPFTDVQMKIKSKAPPAFTTLLLRVCMVKTANLLAHRIGSDCLITGESLGQVASQTIQNLTVTEHFSEFPVLRPLIGMDKEEIIETAREIGTYETSILPYEDCCVLFSPRHPVLHANIQEVQEIYKNLEIDELIQAAFENRNVITYSIKKSLAS